MLIYFVVAPDIFTKALMENGKPQKMREIPAESDRIVYVVDGFESYTKDGERLYNLFGWAFITPKEGASADSFVREIVLISGETIYSFPVESGYRHPDLPVKFAGMQLDWNKLGFSALIADDLIKPGKYRIGLVFRNPSTSAAYYRDKPVHYLVKTPNTIRWERK